MFFIIFHEFFTDRMINFANLLYDYTDDKFFYYAGNNFQSPFNPQVQKFAGS